MDRTAQYITFFVVPYSGAHFSMNYPDFFFNFESATKQLGQYAEQKIPAKLFAIKFGETSYRLSNSYGFPNDT